MRKTIFRDVNEILILKLCCFGDIVFITPTIASLRENFPGARITLLASSWVKELVPYLDLDSVLVFDMPGPKKLPEKVRASFKLISLLRKKKYDLVLLGHRKSAFGIVLLLSNIRYRLGFKGTAFLNSTVEFDENIHETQRYLNILRKNMLRADSHAPILKRVRSKDEIKREHRIPLNKRIIGIFPFGGINPGTKMDIKRWGTENYANLARKTAENFPESFILFFEGIGGDEKTEENNFPENVRTLEINIDLISSCDIFVGGDTGPVHIAAALGVSTLSIFGPSNPNLVMPLEAANGNAVHRYIWKKPECSPCYTPSTAVQRNNKKYWRGNSFVCYVGTHVCMTEINVEEVFETLREIFKADQH